jgi:DNA-binding GntR family transcriptional regulator
MPSPPRRPPSPISVPRSATLRVSPYEKIKQAILDGELAPGQPLLEVTLAEWCGVSRTPIREALRRLEQDGLIGRDHHGLAVRARSPEEILDLYDTRIVLESAAGRVAAERRSDHDLRELQWALAEGREVGGQDSAAMVAANERFHTAVWHSTHNESLIDLLDRLTLHLARYPETTLGTPGRWPTAIIEHEQLVAAIQRRDGEAAAELARLHFVAARDIRLALFAHEGSQPRA